MPELPEIESARRALLPHIVDRPIADAAVRASKLVQGVSAEALADALRGNAFTNIRRHGKFQYLALARHGHLLVHYGMTGELHLHGHAPEAARRQDDLWIRFADGGGLTYDDPRRMGRLALVPDVDAYIAAQGYGPDALAVGEAEFVARVGVKRGALKSVLMDQHVVAGVGNEYSDEILFQVRLHPESRASALGPGRLAAVYHAMRQVLNDAVAADADRARLRQYFFLDHANRRAGLPCPSQCAGSTEWLQVGGRSAYFCPTCQERVT